MHHDLAETYSDKGILHPAIQRMDTYMLSKVAQMADNLSKVQEGSGTILDNTLILYVNAAGGVHHHGENKHAVLLVGKAGGSLSTGRYLDFPEKEHAISDLYVSVANMVDVPITTFGDASICKGPLPGLV